MRNIKDYKEFAVNEEASDGKLLLQDLLKIGRIEEVTFSVFKNAIENTTSLQTNGGRTVSFNGRCDLDTVVFMGSDTGLVFNRNVNPELKIDQDTGGFIALASEISMQSRRGTMVWASVIPERRVLITTDFGFKSTEDAIAFFELHNINNRDTIIAKLKRMQGGKRAFGM